MKVEEEEEGAEAGAQEEEGHQKIIHLLQKQWDKVPDKLKEVGGKKENTGADKGNNNKAEAEVIHHHLMHLQTLVVGQGLKVMLTD